MRNLYTAIIAGLIVFQSFGQQLNNSGHIVSLYATKQTQSGLYSSYANIEINEIHDGLPVVIKIKNTTGIVKNISVSAMINPALSDNGRYLIYSDLQQLHVVDLVSLDDNLFLHSSVFGVDNSGEPFYYDQTKHSFVYTYLIHQLDANDLPVKVITAGNKIIALTRNKLMIDNAVVFPIQQGNYFDVKYINNTIYYSTREKNTKGFEYKLFSLFDSSNKILDHKTMSIKPTQTKSFKNGEEQIRGPLYYHSDSIYYHIGNSYGAYQRYGSGNPYPHPGIDVLGEPYDSVFAVRNGYIKGVITTGGPNYWRIGIANENTNDLTYGYLYAHIEETSMPYIVGDTINAGDYIGYIVLWPVTDFDHCHFARIVDSGAVWMGAWGTQGNPLIDMENHVDTTAPFFINALNNDLFAFRDEVGNYLSPDSLYGGIDIIAKVHDKVNSDWEVDVYEIGYNISPLNDWQNKIVVVKSFTYDFYSDVYYSAYDDSYYKRTLGAIYSEDSTCSSNGDYASRNFYHIVTNTNLNDSIEPYLDSLEIFDTQTLSDGSYILRVYAYDASGNYAVDSMIIGINNTISGIASKSEDDFVELYPNPSTFAFNIQSNAVISTVLVNDIRGRRVYVEVSITSKQASVSHKLSPGIYWIIIETEEGRSVKKLCVK